MASKVLVTYGTWCGATQEVAQAIAQTLQEHGLAADVLPVERVSGVDGYSGVVIGTGVRAGKLHGKVKRFVRRNRQGLGAVPVALFVDCLTMKDDTPANRATVDAYLNPLREAAPGIKPVSVGLFAGAVLTETPEFRRQPFFLRGIIKSMKKGMDEKGGSDYRDWAAIRMWVEQIAPLLQSA
jgi:menaquinone-dependent protoporphyrinogen oxidase